MKQPRDSADGKSNLQSWIIAAIGLITTFAIWHLRYNFPFDDSFITFRYAEHLAHGAGLVWNIGGAHTEGYTNFFYVLLIAPSFWFGIDTLLWAQILNLFAYILSAVWIYRITLDAIGNETRRTFNFIPIVLAVAFLLTPLVWMNALSAMETTFFGCLLLASVYFFSRNIRLSFLFAVAAALTRPEGTILGVILAVQYFRQTAGKDRWKNPLIYFALPLAVYHVWRITYFGSLLPNSFLIKVVNPNAAGGTLFHGRAYVLMFLSSTMAIGLASLLAFRSFRDSTSVRVMLLWTLAVLGFYMMPEAIMGLFDRFLYSAEVFLFVLAGVGLSNFAKERKLWVPIALMLLLLALHTERSFHAPRALEGRSSTVETYRRYSKVAEILKTIPDHEQVSFGFADAGMIPFFSGLKHLDLVGLNDNEIARAKSVDALLSTIAKDSLDMIFVPLDLPGPEDDSCRHIFRAGHGLIGSHYLELVRDRRFADYRTIVLIHSWTYDIAVMENIHSRHARAIEAAFEVARKKEGELLLPPSYCSD